MREKNHQEFFRKYLQQKHSEAEHREFLSWFRSLSEAEAADLIEEYQAMALEMETDRLDFPDRSLISKIEERLDQIETRQEIYEEKSWYRLLKPFAAAATVLLVTSIGFFAYYQQKNPKLTQAPATAGDVAPGDNKALLTLADGSSIVLSDVKEGEIATQTLVRINKDEDGQLVYAPADDYRFSTSNLKKEYNTIATPKSGQYKISLPDGTKVWLNSMSSLRFPVTFDPVERKVELSGEAYFEVTKTTSAGRRIPFRVISNGQTIEVTGTKFNVNTYKDNSYIKTTLLEGGVNVQAQSSGSTVQLKPGEQALVPHKQTADKKISVVKADIEGDLAWTNGYFHFKDTELEEVMQQLIRWYDIEVEYVGTISAERFSGYVSRNVSLSNVLSMLEHGSEVKFELGNHSNVKVFASNEVTTKNSLFLNFNQIPRNMKKISADYN